MDKMRVALAKTDETKYVGHLDFCRAFERALRRAKLPVAYSVGFNPHMRLSFGPALGVGVASEAEYVDVELTEPLESEEFGLRLSAQLPPGLAFVAARTVSTTASLAAALNLACYKVKVDIPPTQDNLSAVRKAVAGFQSAGTVEYVRRTPKGQKTMDIKKFLADEVSVTAGETFIALAFWLRLTSAGAVKPQEVISALTGQFAFPNGPASFCRTALRAENGSGIHDPFEI